MQVFNKYTIPILIGVFCYITFLIVNYFIHNILCVSLSDYLSFGIILVTLLLVIPAWLALPKFIDKNKLAWDKKFTLFSQWIKDLDDVNIQYKLSLDRIINWLLFGYNSATKIDVRTFVDPELASIREKIDQFKRNLRNMDRYQLLLLTSKEQLNIYLDMMLSIINSYNDLIGRLYLDYNAWLTNGKNVIKDYNPYEQLNDPVGALAYIGLTQEQKDTKYGFIELDKPGLLELYNKFSPLKNESIKNGDTAFEKFIQALSKDLDIHIKKAN